MLYTVQTALHCLNSSMYAYAYIVREGKNAVGMGWWASEQNVGWLSGRLDGWIPLRLLGLLDKAKTYCIIKWLSNWLASISQFSLHWACRATERSSRNTSAKLWLILNYSNNFLFGDKNKSLLPYFQLPQAMTKDQNKEKNARTAATMSKGEKIRLALYLGKCVKGTWKRALEITGELLSRLPLNPNNNNYILQRIGSCRLWSFLLWWPM